MTHRNKTFFQHMRKMTSFDLIPVISIENEAYAFPWSKGIFSDCLSSDYHCFVYEVDDSVLGYIIFSIVLDELHLLNICISPMIKNQGYGQSMLNWLISNAKDYNCKTIYLEVRASNHAAIYLYEKTGFNEVGLRPNYYPAKKGKEDALLFAFEILK